MKALVAILLCAVARSATGGAIAWPGANVVLSSPLVNSLVQPATKGFAYSTTQYLNALPASYSFGVRPQYAYQIPQVTAFSPLPGLPAYYPVASASYIPTSSVFYPQLSLVTPSKPQQPIPSAPGAPSAPDALAQPGDNLPATSSEQPQVDDDTTVIESAEFTPQQRDQQRTSTSDSSTKAQSPTNIPDQQQLPQKWESSISYPKNLQIAQFGSFPQIPQFPGGLPQLPQLPQFPQFPQLPSIPQFPPMQSGTPSLQLPQVPSIPQYFPGQGGAPFSPQLPQLPSIPPVSLPQEGSYQPQPPQIPSIPQFPPSQGGSSSPQLPQFPSIPQFPSVQGGSFASNLPSADNTKGLNDEDTVSVESA